jgi:hypothetical protein
MKQCSQCSREIPDNETICDRCAHEGADPVEGQPSLESVVAQTAAPGAPAEAVPQMAGAGTKRLLMFAVLAAVALGGTMTFALLSNSNEPVGAPVPARIATPPATGTAVDAPASTPAVAPVWKANPEWVGFQKRAIAFELPAHNKVPIWLRQAHPYFVVRCVARRTDAFLYMESAAQIEPQDERHTVRVRVDDEPEVTERWQDSDEHDSLFAPDGAQFVQRLIRARTLQVGYRPHNAAPVVAEFTVAGLGEAIAPFAAQCGWKK